MCFWKLGAAVLSFELLNEILCIPASLLFLAKLVNVHFSPVMSTPWPCGPLCTANGLNHTSIQLHSFLLIENSPGNNKQKPPLSRTFKKNLLLFLFSKSYYPSLPLILFHGSKTIKTPLSFYLQLYCNGIFSTVLDTFYHQWCLTACVILHRTWRILNFIFQG